LFDEKGVDLERLSCLDGEIFLGGTRIDFIYVCPSLEHRSEQKNNQTQNDKLLFTPRLGTRIKEFKSG